MAEIFPFRPALLVLHTAKAQVETVEMSASEKILNVLVDPNVGLSPAAGLACTGSCSSSIIPAPISAGRRRRDQPDPGLLFHAHAADQLSAALLS